MAVLVGGALSRIWPAILVLTIIHLLIDIGKSALSAVRPKWVVGPYFIDQFLHIGSIWLVSQWINSQIPQMNAPDTTRLLVYGIAYLLTTVVWYVTERMVTWSNPAYRAQVQRQSWSRMATRAVFLSLFLVVLGVAPFQQSIQPSLAITTTIPYLSGEYRLRPFMTDVAVALACGLFVHAFL
jgi:hypothetical protein